MSINTAVILTAGKGERMMPLTREIPKGLLDFGGITILRKTIYQLLSNNITNIIVVAGYMEKKVTEELKNIKKGNITIIINKKFNEDQNIYSLSLAINKITSEFLIIEADTVFDDDLIEYISGDNFNNRSVWFTKGKFAASQYGGILKSDKNKNILDIRIVPEYLNKYNCYKKLTGIMRVGMKEIEKFKTLIGQHVIHSIQEYYLVPWIENISSLPAIEADISNYDFATFNTPEEYFDVVNHRSFLSKYKHNGIHLIETKKLKHIEDFSRNKVKKLVSKILNEGMWTSPICVERNHWLVLDGQHRFEVAKELGIKYIPAMLFNYSEIRYWPLRDNYTVSIEIICDKSLSGDIFPFKSVKHDFNTKILSCKYPIDNLR